MYNEMFIFLVYALMSFDKHIYHITHIQAVGDLCLLRKFTSPFPSPSLLLYTWQWITTAHPPVHPCSSTHGDGSLQLISNFTAKQSQTMQSHSNAVPQQCSHTAMQSHNTHPLVSALFSFCKF